MCVLLKKYVEVSIFIFNLRGDKKRMYEGEEFVSYSLLSNVWSGWFLAKLKLGARSSIQVSHVGDKNPILLASTVASGICINWKLISRSRARCFTRYTGVWLKYLMSYLSPRLTIPTYFDILGPK